MKKILYFLVAVIFSYISILNANAECSYEEINELQSKLDNFTFDLTYADDYIDMNGDFQEGFFRISTNNLPEGFTVSFSNQYNLYEISNGETLTLNGGVYNVEFYNSICEEPVKSYELKIPYYKQYCELNGNCEKDIWFDGTYENKAENQNKKDENKINTRLVIVLVSLIIIIVIFITILIIKRRRIK